MYVKTIPTIDSRNNDIPLLIKFEVFDAYHAATFLIGNFILANTYN